MFRITALTDNISSNPVHFAAEHGLSFYVEYGGRTILFDCGQTDVFLRNAQLLGLAVNEVDAVVLSHGHYDHGGGYRYLMESGAGGRELYVGKDFFVPKYAKNGEQLRNLTPGWGKPFLEEKGVVCHTVERNLELFPGAYLISGFPRIHDFETIPERFVQTDREGYCQDDFHDEICLALQTKKGIVMVVGCSHPGIVNMVTHVADVLRQPVWAVFGGTHLAEADSGRIHKTIESLKRMGLEVLGLSHCSGEGTEHALAGMEDVTSCYLAAGQGITIV